MELKGRTVVVTGAGSGIGRSLAIEFARNGSQVVCCGRRKERLEETLNLIKLEGGTGEAVSVDITDRVQVCEMVKTVLLHFKKIDILFNNAADFQSMAGIYEVEPELWWHDVTVNLYGSLLVIREILPHMISRNEGIIINMDGGRPAGGSGYSCGKAGLMELTRIMVEELKMIKSSVMVFRAGPGLVRTEMTELQTNTVAGRKWFKTKDSFDQGKVRKPEEIARATIKMVKAARPESSGKSYGPDTDFSDF
jgi:3-oxoacyl-[acyl-carrier protein] reductase